MKLVDNIYSSFQSITLDRRLMVGAALTVAVSAVALAIIFAPGVAALTAASIVLSSVVSFLGAIGLTGLIYLLANEILGRLGTSLPPEKLIQKLQNDFGLLEQKFVDAFNDNEGIKELFNRNYYIYKTRINPTEKEYTDNLKMLNLNTDIAAHIQGCFLQLFFPQLNVQIYSDFLNSVCYTDAFMQEENRDSLPGPIKRYLTRGTNSDKRVEGVCKWEDLQTAPLTDHRKLFLRGTYHVIPFLKNKFIN